MPSIIVFPGQGSQFVGMGQRLLGVPKVDRMFELASRIFKTDILNLCLNGPKSELDKTVNCQVAVFVTSMAAVEYLKQTKPEAVKECYATAGFSIGEYASLVLANAIKFEDALRLIKTRSEAMQKASEAVPSGLASVFLTRESKLNLAMMAARKWCNEKLKLTVPVECEVANYLYWHCRVVGGNKEALAFIELNRDEFKLKRVKRLAVSGAFHTSLMQPAESSIRAAVEATDVTKPLIRFYSNYDAELCTSPKKIRFNLVRQVSNPVKWEQTLNTLYLDQNLLQEPENEQPASESSSKKTNQSQDRVYPEIYECGPASQTGPILKAINFKAYKLYKHIET